MGLDLKDARIVLVRPRNPLNIAAAARAMRNFGLNDLAVVAAYEPVWQDARAAPGAEKLLQNVLVVPRLLDALDDRTFVLGTSSLSRRQPTQPTFSLSQLGSLLKKHGAVGRFAVLFGSEKTGLSNQDLSHCHAVLRIPTEPSCPTMNLGQAVAVCCYELQRAVKPDRRKATKEKTHDTKGVPRLPLRASVGEVMRLLAEWEKLLGQETGKSEKRECARSLHVRELFLRLGLTSPDVTLLLGVLRDIGWRVRSAEPRL